MIENLTSDEVREKFLKFFEKRNHNILPSASLIPENDSSVLFNTAGMQPLVPFILGQKHPSGKKLASVQKCLRTNDIQEVGDNTHFTFFEMLGNWSLGDYFKEDALSWSFQFLTDENEGLGLDVNRIYVTVFEGNDDAPKDTEAYDIWENIFKKAGLNPKERIFFMNEESNLWSAGENGPCGPDSEIFYDVREKSFDGLDKESFINADNKQEVVEIWNNVFMQFLKKDGKIVSQLENKNVDTGAGLERLVSIVQNKKSPYETDLFSDFIKFIEEKTGKKYQENEKDFKILLDHLRASIFLISDGVSPLNKDQGYILRKLLRILSLKMKHLGLGKKDFLNLINIFIEKYSDVYENISENKENIILEIEREILNFSKTLEKGMKEFEKMINLSNKNNNLKKIGFGEINICDLAQNEINSMDAFKLISTYGLPEEIILEELERKGLCVNVSDLKNKLKEHSQKSSSVSTGKFKGGMSGDSLKITASHTATHLMLAGLQEYLGKEVHQRGSNINEDRIRFDFNYDGKVERDILDKVEEYVNNAIDFAIEMVMVEMSKEKALEKGVEGSFWEKYPEIVKVWILEKDGKIFSEELCGGPHVKNTSDILKFGKFKIKKESSVASGVRRIRAVFE